MAVLNPAHFWDSISDLGDFLAIFSKLIKKNIQINQKIDIISIKYFHKNQNIDHY
jgi:hypothetical protein